jgi:hypothetical protein
MMQIERTVTAGPRLSLIEDVVPQGFREADSAELANVEGGLWGIVLLAVVIVCALEKAAN